MKTGEIENCEKFGVGSGVAWFHLRPLARKFAARVTSISRNIGFRRGGREKKPPARGSVYSARLMTGPNQDKYKDKVRMPARARSVSGGGNITLRAYSGTSVRGGRYFAVCGSPTLGSRVKEPPCVDF